MSLSILHLEPRKGFYFHFHPSSLTSRARAERRPRPAGSDQWWGGDGGCGAMVGLAEGAPTGALGSPRDGSTLPSHAYRQRRWQAMRRQRAISDGAVEQPAWGEGESEGGGGSALGLRRRRVEQQDAVVVELCQPSMADAVSPSMCKR